jgi:Family of unknown function (DUF5994)
LDELAEIDQRRSDSFISPAQSAGQREVRNGHGSQALAVNNGVRGRRLASPVRVSLALELGGDLDGAWWPHSASVAQELPELIGALVPRLGQIVDISVNWSALAGSPNLDWGYRAATAEVVPCRQRLMTITGSTALARLLVVPNRTASVLAVMVLRRAADLPVEPAERQSEVFRTADHFVRAARVESARCSQRLQLHDKPLERDA